MEREFIANQEVLRPKAERESAERDRLEELRGMPLSIGSLEEMIDDNHAIVSSAGGGPEHYVNILSFVDADQLEPGVSVLLHNKTMSVVGILGDEADPTVSVMKVEKAPLESYADIGGLEKQIQEIKEAVELPLTHPEMYEDIGKWLPRAWIQMWARDVDVARLPLSLCPSLPSYARGHISLLHCIALQASSLPRVLSCMASQAPARRCLQRRWLTAPVPHSCAW